MEYQPQNSNLLITNFGASSLSVDVVLMLIFYFLLAVYVIFTAIFYYHWQQYGTDTGVTRLTFLAYFVTTLPLIATLCFTALLF